MFIGLTTVETRQDADRLASEAVAQNLAVCVQIDGPITSHYKWEGKQEKSEEYRLIFKFLPQKNINLETWLNKHHPYQTPEWIVLRAEHISEKYLSWALGSTNLPPL